LNNHVVLIEFMAHFGLNYHFKVRDWCGFISIKFNGYPIYPIEIVCIETNFTFTTILDLDFSHIIVFIS